MRLSCIIIFMRLMSFITGSIENEAAALDDDDNDDENDDDEVFHLTRLAQQKVSFFI